MTCVCCGGLGEEERGRERNASDKNQEEGDDGRGKEEKGSMHLYKTEGATNRASERASKERKQRKEGSNGSQARERFRVL